MISANQYKLTWTHFDDINPDKRIAFENLCRSLFCRKYADKYEVVHSNPNHPGVEVSPVHSQDGIEMISFQAKYFDGNIEYDQIKSSMKTAIEYYGGILDKIYLYCNKDVNTTTKSYIDIEKMLTNAGIDLVPITGQSILDGALEFPSILACYFGLDKLDKSWFELNLKLSLDNLGGRYNGRFNIDTDAKRKMALFLHNAEGISLLNRKKADVVEELKDIRWRCDGNYKRIINNLIFAIENLEDVQIDSVSDVLKWKELVEKASKEELIRLTESIPVIEGAIDKENHGSEQYYKLSSELYVVNFILRCVERLAITQSEKSLLCCQALFVTGEMGTGKSQLLATSAKNELSEGRNALLMLGQTFTSNEPVEMQMMNGLLQIDTNESFDALLGAMDEIAYESNERAFIFIDAINESRDKDIWVDGLNRLITIMGQYDNLRLVVSLRSGFEQVLYSDKVQNELKAGKIASIKHEGLMDDSPKPIFEFLSKYGVPASPEFYLQREMCNPLFITWFCQTYAGEEHGLISLISTVLDQADKEASKATGHEEPYRLLKDLLFEYIDISEKDYVTKRRLLGMETWQLYGVADKVAYINASERAGVLISYIRNGEEYYYIGYNLLEDYIRASRIVEKYDSIENLKDYCLKELFKIDSNGNVTDYGNESIFAMVCSLYAIKNNEECIDIIDAIKVGWERKRIIDAYFKTFTWRNPQYSLMQIVELMNKYKIARSVLWSIFIECATKENSILNADGLFQLLDRYSLSKRDYLWTIAINDLTEDDRIISLAYYLESGNELRGLSDTSVKYLLSLFTWMLSSSNRVLRDRISKAMIEVLKGRFSLCSVVLEKFKNVNDPYIIQRLYGIIFGAVMKRSQTQIREFESLARLVYSEVFDKEKVYPDILLRDYARLIIERFIYENPDREGFFEKEKIMPPYSSCPIPQADVVDYDEGKYHESGMLKLLYSMKFNMDVKGAGMYGDFGRYVFQSALHDFIGVDMKNVYYYALEYIIKEIGYSNQLFGKYDTDRVYIDRHQLKKVERIGKKYEWIAMYNILARLSDYFKVRGENWNDEIGKDYSGPWNLYVRDFDPTLNTKIKHDRSMFPVFEEAVLNEVRFIDSDSSDEEINAWVRGDDEIYQHFPDRFIRIDRDGVEWISIYLYQERKKEFPGVEDSFLSLPRGEQHIWAISAMHIADDSQNVSIELLQTSGYLRKHSGINPTRDSYTLFSREYAWSPGYISEFLEDDFDECEVKAIPATINTIWGEQYDASQDETTSYYIPTGDIISALGLYQKSVDGAFFYNDQLAAFDTRIIGDKHGELLIRKDLLELFIAKRGVSVFWDVVGEKQFFLGRDGGQIWQRREGYFLYDANRIEGKIEIVPNII
ncbi:hypothetical protein D081_0221 [Anaerovibrio sp. JC8]|uniref:hypothetical protein n=1 Tax=Anaerovibrio sp. JC8 TaxID=1240085 RepID=UPI000A0C2B17|nr:hypothetical protein [Anaerovibrio sp. JC8]ORU01402.1 hypothetical protein D081_0221 [Anaerovibrio sp. JC8]